MGECGCITNKEIKRQLIMKILGCSLLVNLKIIVMNKVLIADSHYGIYCPQVAIENLVAMGIVGKDIWDKYPELKEGPDAEWYWDAWDSFLMDNPNVSHDEDVWYDEFQEVVSALWNSKRITYKRVREFSDRLLEYQKEEVNGTIVFLSDDSYGYSGVLVIAEECEECVEDYINEYYPDLIKEEREHLRELMLCQWSTVKDIFDRANEAVYIV